MSDNNDVKELAKLALRMGFDAGKPLAKKALESNTVQTLVALGVDIAVDVLSSVTAERSKKETPKKPWNETIPDEVFKIDQEKLKQENPELYKKLSEKPTSTTR